jgi:hypothetical protein
LKIEIDFRCTKLGRDEKNDPQDAVRKLSSEARSPIGPGMADMNLIHVLMGQKLEEKNCNMLQI